MVKIIWTENALQDIEDIAEFIAKDSLHYAKITIKNLYNSTKILKHQPKLGRKVPEVGEESIRELIHGNYRIIYNITNKNYIQILTVHHSSRDLSQSSIFEIKSKT